jgi:hypothetical protein
MAIILALGYRSSTPRRLHELVMTGIDNPLLPHLTSSSIVIATHAETARALSKASSGLD